MNTKLQKLKTDSPFIAGRESAANTKANKRKASLASGRSWSLKLDAGKAVLRTRAIEKIIVRSIGR